jgi:hypothetical protein
MKGKYTAPTISDIKRVFGAEVSRNIIKIKHPTCQDAKKYIAKLEKIYEGTKKSTLQFD